MADQHAVGDVLPSVDLRIPGGGTVGWRDVRHVTVAVFLHGADCPGCLAYLREVDPEGRLAAWGGRVLAVVDGLFVAEGMIPGSGVLRVSDPDGAARHAVGLEPGVAAVLVIDRFGQVFGRWVDDSGHRLPAASQVLEEVRFVGIQCPECEVPDVPPAGA